MTDVVAGETERGTHSTYYAVLYPDDRRTCRRSSSILRIRPSSPRSSTSRPGARHPRLRPRHDHRFEVLLGGSTGRWPRTSGPPRIGAPGLRVRQRARGDPRRARGLHPDNPVNRARETGVQIELPPRCGGTTSSGDGPTPRLSGAPRRSTYSSRRWRRRRRRWAHVRPTIVRAMDLRIFIEPQQGASYERVARLARRAEHLGFDGFFSSDHYFKMSDVSGLPGPLDTWTTLAGLARDTTSLRLGPLVTPVTFRLPGPLAIAVAQIDDMSGGRIEWRSARVVRHGARGVRHPVPAHRRSHHARRASASSRGCGDAPRRDIRIRRRALRIEARPRYRSPAAASPADHRRRQGPEAHAGARRDHAAEFNIPFPSLRQLRDTAHAWCGRHATRSGTTPIRSSSRAHSSCAVEPTRPSSHIGPRRSAEAPRAPPDGPGRTSRRSGRAHRRAIARPAPNASTSSAGHRRPRTTRTRRRRSRPPPLRLRILVLLKGVYTHRITQRTAGRSGVRGRGGRCANVAAPSIGTAVSLVVAGVAQTVVEAVFAALPELVDLGRTRYPPHYGGRGTVLSAKRRRCRRDGERARSDRRSPRSDPMPTR